MGYFFFLVLALTACKLALRPTSAGGTCIGGDGTPIEVVGNCPPIGQPEDPILNGRGASPDGHDRSLDSEHSILPKPLKIRRLTFSENFDLLHSAAELGLNFLLQVPEASALELAGLERCLSKECEPKPDKVLILRGAVTKANAKGYTRLIARFLPVDAGSIGIKSHLRLKHVSTAENPQPWSVNSVITTNNKMIIRLVCVESRCVLLSSDGKSLGTVEELDLHEWHDFDITLNLVQMYAEVAVDGNPAAFRAALSPDYIATVLGDSPDRNIGVWGTAIGTAAGKAGELHIDNIKIENLKPVLAGENLVPRQCIRNLLELSNEAPSPTSQVSYAWCLGLGRNPSLKEVAAENYVAKLNARAIAPLSIAKVVYSSGEFQKTFQTDELSHQNFIRFTFKLLLLREVDSASEARLLAQLNDPAIATERVPILRKQIFFSLIDSAEFLTKHPTLKIIP